MVRMYAPHPGFGRYLAVRVCLGMLLGILIALAAGCSRDEVQAYRVPKDAPAPGEGHAHDAAPQVPRIRWTTPAGWQEREAEGIRAARLAVPAQEGPDADVSVIPMPGITAGRHDIVNLWRQQVKLDPLSEEAITESAVRVPVGDGEGEFFEMASAEPLIDDKYRARILVAMLKQGELMWFFKMTGVDAEVVAQKEKFLAFLKSVQFEPAAGGGVGEAGTASSAGTAGGGGDRPAWEVPAGWQEQPPTQMLLAKFSAGDAAGKVEITVSSFPGDTGGLMANVNRWRGQIGLAPVSADEVNQLVSPLDAGGTKAMLVDLAGDRAGQKVRLIGVILPRSGETWFYKMLGDAPVAEREKPALIRFVQSVRYK